MISNYLKYLAFIAGGISVLVSLLYGNFHTQFIKPFFHLFIFLFYISVTKKWNPFLFLFLGAAMVGEYLTANNFTANYTYIVLLFTIYFSTGIYIMLPIIRAAKLKIQITDFYLSLIILAAFVYIVGSIFLFSVKEMDHFVYLLIATIAFSFFTGACFYIAAYHTNNSKIYYFIVGLGYMIVCAGTLIHELILHSVFIQVFINLVEVIAQFSFVYALTKLPKMIKPNKQFI